MGERRTRQRSPAWYFVFSGISGERVVLGGQDRGRRVGRDAARLIAMEISPPAVGNVQSKGCNTVGGGRNVFARVLFRPERMEEVPRHPTSRTW